MLTVLLLWYDVYIANDLVGEMCGSVICGSYQSRLCNDILYENPNFCS